MQHSPENSNFDNSWDQDGFTDNRVQMTIVDRILKEYLPELMTHGAHIVASVPIYKPTAAPAFYRLTSMAFRTYTETSVSNGGADAELSRPEQILFVLGMTANGAPPRATTFKPSARWVVHARAGFSHGTFAISRNTFHLRLHSLLARVNALTTLVPVSPSYDGMAGGRDIVQQWAKHKDFSRQPCDWKAVDSDDNLTADKFEWQYTREWNMSEEGTRLAVRGNYFVSCESKPAFPHCAVSELDASRYDPQRTRVAGRYHALQRVTGSQDVGHDQAEDCEHAHRQHVEVRSLGIRTVMPCADLMGPWRAFNFQHRVVCFLESFH